MGYPAQIAVGTTLFVVIFTTLLGATGIWYGALWKSTPSYGLAAKKESNWPPTPSGNFTLWLRLYIPGAAILNGHSKVPPIDKVS